MLSPYPRIPRKVSGLFSGSGFPGFCCDRVESAFRRVRLNGLSMEPAPGNKRCRLSGRVIKGSISPNTKPPKRDARIQVKCVNSDRNKR